MADNEILPTSCTRMFPTMGIMQFNKNTTNRAKSSLVGDHLNLADIAVAGTLLNRFTTVIKQPNSKAVIGSFTLYSKMTEDHIQASTLCSTPHTGTNITRCLNVDEPVWTGIGTPHHHYVEPEGPPLQHVPVLSRDKPDGHTHPHIADLSIAKPGLPLQPEDLHLMKVSDYSTAEPGLAQLQELPDGLPQLQVSKVSTAGRDLPPLQDLSTDLHDLTCSNMSKRKEMSQDPVEADSARQMDVEQEARTRERSERDNSTEEIIIPDSPHFVRSSEMVQLLQETDLTKQASSKGFINRMLPHTFTESRTQPTHPSQALSPTPHSSTEAHSSTPACTSPLDCSTSQAKKPPSQ